MRILIVYTTDAQTARFAKRLSLRLSGMGHDARLADLRSLAHGIDASLVDAIVVGGSLNGQIHRRRVKRFIRDNLAALRSRPSAFLTVGHAIASRSPGEHEAAKDVPRRFCVSAGWTPHELEVIDGTRTLIRAGFLRRLALRWMAGEDPAEAETADWARVDAFASVFARRLMRRRSAVASLRPNPEKPRPTA